MPSSSLAMSAAPTMLLFDSPAQATGESSPPTRRKEEKHLVRVAVVGTEAMRTHLGEILSSIDDRGALVVSLIDPRDLPAHPLHDPSTGARRHDLIFVALASALEVCALLTGPELPLETVVVAVTSDQSLTEEDVGSAPVAGLLHSPVSLPALRHTLHKLMPRHCSCAPPLPALTAGRPAARVLQVEPCAVTANATQLMFAEFGLWMDTAADGPSAMQLLGRRPYDLLLCDLNLPGEISGCALASWYKHHCLTHHRPPSAVIVLTAEPLVPNYTAFGVDFWLQRPLSTQYIAQLLSDWLRSAKPHRAGADAPLPPLYAAS